MSHMKFLSILSFVILVQASGCNIPVRPAVEVGSGATAQTAVFNISQETLTAEAVSPPTLTPTFTLTLTPEAPMVSVSTSTFCRSGPGTIYDQLGTLYVGQKARVLGRNEYNDTWVIELPADPPVTCWLWGHYATVTGDTDGLPVIETPPTPTPTPDFTYSYHSWGVGPGFQCIYFDVTDTGGTTWQSYKLKLLDASQGVSGSASANTFVSYDAWCTPTETLLDLTPAETGNAMVVMHMLNAFGGDTFEATLTLCSGDNQTGLCMTKSITYIP